MNRRQKIIVSITGIFIVLLALVGLTYAYFLTRITGNENPKSISVTTANLRLIYDDGSDGVIGGNNLIPSDEIYEKQFTVYNDGNANVTYGLYLINVVNTFERKEDIQYTLGCSTDGELECKMNGITTFPSGNFRMVENTIEPGVTHTYTFRFTYKETGTDQSVDMGKELSAKIQIFGKDGEFVYIPFEEDTLAHSILKSAKSTTLEKSQTLGYAYYSETPLTTPAEKESGKNESTLSLTEDDYGDSYYFRGNVKNNYVNFAGMCWRAVRIEGDGSVKLILDDRYAECNSSSYTGEWGEATWVEEYDENDNVIGGYWDAFKYVLFGYKDNEDTRADFLNYEETDGLQYSFKSFQTYLAKKMNSNLNDESTQTAINNTLKQKLKIDEWCYDDKVTSTEQHCYDDDYCYTDEYYGAYTRIIINKMPSLKCSGTKLTKFKDNTNMYVATLTADEASFAGYNRWSYLSTGGEWLSLSLSYFDADSAQCDHVFIGDDFTTLCAYSQDYYSRPAITLKSGSVITEGVGTLEKPYVIG